ncbi:hypothetical protein [Burkholderia gladioli]|uniref:hypothetical protein n=1 Tax=Burkholderia gladioli TaxID=28095 RepID=UPI00163EB430|nr:hypothetical protein [Burkholderia gladioli]
MSDANDASYTFRYDPVGRLIEAIAPGLRERFAFDPASNIMDPGRRRMSGRKLAWRRVVKPRDFNPANNGLEKINLIPDDFTRRTGAAWYFANIYKNFEDPEDETLFDWWIPDNE